MDKEEMVLLQPTGSLQGRNADPYALTCLILLVLSLCGLIALFSGLFAMYLYQQPLRDAEPEKIFSPTITPKPASTHTVLPPNHQPEGYHDGDNGRLGSDRCTAFGWAVDPDDRGRKLKVQILADGHLVTTITANKLRPDVKVCKEESCGFSVNLWGLISSGDSHQITTQAFDEETSMWVNLSNTSKFLSCMGYPVGYYDGYSGHVNQSQCVVFGWTFDPDNPEENVSVQVLLDETVVVSSTAIEYRSDLNKPDGCPGGTCGFKFNLWDLLSHDTQHVIRIQALDVESNTWKDLRGSPKMLNCAS